MTLAKDDSAARIGPALSLAVGFLERRQLPSGELEVYRFSDVALETDPQVKSTPYGTSYVLYSLAFVDEPRVAAMAARAISFLLAEMEAPGLWRYYGSDNLETLPPDLDDTACAAFALRNSHDYMLLGLNHRLFLLNRDADGRFRTFLTNVGDNNVCALVNANVVLYLGEREATLAACDYLSSVVTGGREGKRSIYGVDDLSFFYVLSRAFFQGVKRLGASREAAIERILARRRPDGSLGGNELNTALAVSSLLNFGCAERTTIAEAIRYLLERQNEAGFWPRAAFYIDFGSGFYGSEELTTALCIEALARSRSVVC